MQPPLPLIPAHVKLAQEKTNVKIAQEKIKEERKANEVLRNYKFKLKIAYGSLIKHSMSVLIF